MADPAPAAAPAAASPTAMGNLFQSYDPQGALNGMFAPAMIRSYAPSEQAVAAWNAQNHALTPDMINQLRMPNAYQPPSAQGGLSGSGLSGSGLLNGMLGTAGGAYGAGRIPQTQTLGDPLGQVDPNALRALAQGGPYDIAARRNAIAARLASNAALQSAYGG